MSKRKNIALFVAMIENEFSYAVCEGALQGAKEIGANLFILPAGIIDAKYDDYESNCFRYQYNTLYSCIDENSIDAIVIEYGTVTSFLDEKKKKEFLEGMGNIPIMLIAGQEEGYSSVCVDNQGGLKDAICHITDYHGCTKVGFVSGPKTSQDALERLAVFQETMKEKGMENVDDWIVYGNFSEFCEPYVTDLISRHPDIEAIICANDQMAMGTYNVLRKLGKEVGKDILVTGFDDSPTAVLLEPNLTSVRADTKELARKAVVMCENIMKGELVETSVKSRLILRESCGCQSSSMIEDFLDEDCVELEDSLQDEVLEKLSSANKEYLNRFAKQRMVYAEKIKVFEMVLTNITRDMLQFSSSEAKKYNSVLTKFKRMEFESGYIFTYGRGISHAEGETWNQPEVLYTKAYYDQDDVHLYNGNECEVPLKGLFDSDMMPRNRRFDMLVMPLFSREELFGLMLTESAFEYFRYATQIACQVSVSMEVIEIIKKQNAIKKELEKNLSMMEENNRILAQMSHSDPLTGIANRRGFLDTVKMILEDERNLGKKAIAVYADMDCLKIVNDEFGHDEGDYSLKTIAKALSESFRQTDVVARMGGDEFAAFALVSQDNFAEILRERVHTILKKLNENDKPYYVNMSLGMYEFIIESDTNLDHVLSAADENLYKEKKNKVKVVYKNQ